MNKPTYEELEQQVRELECKANEVEKAAQREKERYRTLFEGIGDAIFVHRIGAPDELGTFLEVNNIACSRLGYTREELLNMSPMEINAPGLDVNIPALIQELLEKKEMLTEAVHVAKDGKHIPVEIHAHVIPIEGEMTVISITRDITERKKWEKKLQETHEQLEKYIQERTVDLQKSEAQYKRLLEEIPGMLYQFSVKRGGRFYSQRVATILKYPLIHFYESPSLWHDCIHPEDIGKVDEAIDLFKVGTDFDLEYRIKDATGEWHWFSDRSIGRWTESDDMIIEGLAVDITKQKKAEQEQLKLMNQLREVQRMEAIGTLAGGIAHDFNNILAAIIGYSEMAVEIIPADNPANPMVQHVLKAGNRAKELVKQILAFSRQGTGERKPIQIQKLAWEAIKLLEATIPKSIQIRTEINDTCGTVMADPTQVHQVMMNLCTNSYHAMRKNGGTLEVTVKQVKYSPPPSEISQPDQEDYILMEVRDTGHGMNKAVLERIFDPYFTTKKKGEGTGLGLSVVHGIVISHNGHITVDSEPGKGTCFQIYFPVIQQANDTPIAEPITIPMGNNEHILLLDDEELLADMGQQVLTRLGYRVTAFTNAKDALHAFQAHPDDFQLVITDMSMPNMSGTELGQKLLAIRPDISLILFTGFSEMMNEAKAKKLGFKGFVMKPMVTSKLATIIRNVLDEKTP